MLGATSSADGYGVMAGAADVQVGESAYSRVLGGRLLFQSVQGEIRGDAGCVQKDSSLSM